MAKNIDIKDYKALVNKKITEVGPRYMDMMLAFINENFDNGGEPEKMKLAHKLHGKWFDSTIPKKQVMETKTEVRILDDRFDRFIDNVTVDEHKRIEVEEAQIIDPEEAMRIKNG